MDGAASIALARVVRTVLKWYYGDTGRFRDVFPVAYTVLSRGDYRIYGEGKAIRIHYGGKNGFYETAVNIDGYGKCSCRASAVYGRVCKHMLAAWSILALYRATHGLAPAVPPVMFVSRFSPAKHPQYR